MLKYKIPQIVTLTPEILEFQSFALIFYLLSRCVRYFNLQFYKTS